MTATPTAAWGVPGRRAAPAGDRERRGGVRAGSAPHRHHRESGRNAGHPSACRRPGILARTHGRSPRRARGRTVIADLSGPPLHAALEGGVDVLKVSHEEVLADGWAASDGVDDLLAAVSTLQGAGAGRVVVSRADRPALATAAGGIVEVVSPRLEPVDVHGAGDSMTAGVAAALARGDGWEDALRLGAAAGSLNVTRRGLATGRRREIERLARHVELRPLDRHGAISTRTETPEELAARTRPQ